LMRRERYSLQSRREVAGAYSVSFPVAMSPPRGRPGGDSKRQYGFCTFVSHARVAPTATAARWAARTGSSSEARPEELGAQADAQARTQAFARLCAARAGGPTAKTRRRGRSMRVARRSGRDRRARESRCYRGTQVRRPRPSAAGPCPAPPPSHPLLSGAICTAPRMRDASPRRPATRTPRPPARPSPSLHATRASRRCAMRPVAQTIVGKRATLSLTLLQPRLLGAPKRFVFVPGKEQGNARTLVVTNFRLIAEETLGCKRIFQYKVLVCSSSN